MKKQIVWKILSIVSSITGLFVLSLFSAIYLVTVAKNPVGALLTIIGCDITGLGLGLVILGNLEIDESSSLWKNEQVFATHGEPKSISYPFHLEKTSIVEGSISGKAGPYEFFLTEFFGTEEEMVETTERVRRLLAIKPKIHWKGKGPGKSVIGPINLPPGNYALRFGKHISEIEASFSLNKTVRKKPYESYYPFGLALLEVGIPVLITGVVSLGYGKIVS